MKPVVSPVITRQWLQGLVILAAPVVLSGCVNFKANYIDPMYGEIAGDVAPVRAGGEPVEMAANAPSISQGFNPAPLEKEQKSNPQDHPGIDIVASRGTPVLAATGGTVVDSTFDPAFGHQVSILHGKNVDGQDIKSNYVHLQKKWVRVGDKVIGGQQIGELGSSGLFAAFPHLHFEVRFLDHKGRWIPLNPHLFWRDGIGIVSCFSDDNAVGDGFSITYPVQCRNLD